jgi:two-component system, cell cycle sensor histidine kinase and response regulator CckA
VDSEPGQGAQFRIYLPAHAAEGAGPDTPVHAAASGAGAGILVLEDDPTVRVFAAEVPRKAGYAVLEARTPDEALRMARPGVGIDLLLSDVVMPGMNGPETAERIQAALPATRLLFMSGYSGAQTLQAGVLDRGIPFLPKPFTAAALLARVEETLRRTAVWAGGR